MANDFLSMENLPRAAKFDSHVWVDYIELLCIVNIDRIASKGDVLDRLRPSNGDLPEDAEMTADDVQPDFEADAEYSDEIVAQVPAELNDRWSNRLNDWFQHLLYRKGAFGANYPFTITDTIDVLQLKENLTDGQRFYVFLLLCSNLSHCKGFIAELTGTFEQLSSEVMKNFLSTEANVHIFGTSENSNNSSSKLYRKVEALAKELGEILHVQETDFAPSNSGDGGLDIVASVSMGDTNSHKIVIFGQCACTDKWKDKQFSSGAERWRQFMTLGGGAINIIFIPYCIRGADGSWHSKHEIANVMVDRQRFLFAMTGKESQLSLKPAYEVVLMALSQREDIY